MTILLETSAMQKENQSQHSNTRLIVVVAGLAVCCLASAVFLIVRYYQAVETMRTGAVQPMDEHPEARTFEEFLAQKLPDGMQAAPLTLPNDRVSAEMPLYPGCFVDVIEHRTLQDSPSGDSYRATMLHGIPVITVWQAPPDSNMVRLALLVKPEQAEALAKAQETGNVSLTLLNPVTRLPLSDSPLRLPR
jgi:hypothetical protein